MLTRSALNNPAAVAAAVALVALLGVASLLRLPVQLFPDLSNPRISIHTVWPNTSPMEIEAELVEPIEEVLQGTPGVESMSSWTNRGDAWVNLEFARGSDMNTALLDVIARMNRLPPLPRDARPPVIMGGGDSQNTPALSFFFVQQLPGTSGSIEDAIPYIEDVVRPAIEAVPGVANVQVSNGGGGPQQLDITFDPYKAAQLGVQLSSIAGTIASANDVSGGYVPVGRRQYTLRFTGRYQPRELEEMVLEWRDGTPVRLGDVATVAVTRGDAGAPVTQNGNPAMSVRVDKESGANALATLVAVKAVVQELADGPLKDRGLAMAQSFDATVFIYQAIQLVTGNLVLGMLLAVGVLWWFLRRLRATLIVAVAIPVSLLATFIVLDLTGRTLNVISLAGLAFAVGMVLDAAIVVLENIVRLREQGLGLTESAVQGTRQVWGALLASTVTTVAIFVPVFFLDGIEGQLFGDLALTIAIAVCISLVVAVTVLPVAARLWVRDRALTDNHADTWQRLTAAIMRLTANPRRRLALVAGLVLLPCTAAWLLLPALDYLPPVKRVAVDTYFQTPAGATWETIDTEIVQELDRRMAPYMAGERQPALKNYYILTWPGGGTMGARAQDQGQVDELERLIRDEIFTDLPDVRHFTSRGNLFGDYGGDRGIFLHLQSRDSEALRQLAEQTQGWVAEALPGTQPRANPSLDLAAPELRVTANDRALGEAGWDRAQLGQTIRTLGSGLYVGEYFNGEQRMDMFLRSARWHSPDELENTPLVTRSGAVVPLYDLAQVERTVGPTNLKRLDRRRTITVQVQPPEGMSLEESLALVREQVAPKVRAAMPPDGNLLIGGSADQLRRAISVMGGNFLTALLVLFLIMAALFRSTRDAALALLAMPLAMVGGVLALRGLSLFTFQPLDLLTMIGFVILLGLVVNNAILLVHQTRSAERDGLGRHAAVEQALRTRLRPIFMSSMTSVFGMLPLLLMPGEGSVIYRGLAAVIVGGMLVSTLFTLILLPALLRLGASTAPASDPVTAQPAGALNHA